MAHDNQYISVQINRSSLLSVLNFSYKSMPHSLLQTISLTYKMAGYGESNWMWKSSSSKQNRSAASQQILYILWNLKVHYHFQNKQLSLS